MGQSSCAEPLGWIFVAPVIFVSLLFSDFETAIPRAHPPLGKKWMLLSASRELGLMKFFTQGDAESSL